MKILLISALVVLASLMVDITAGPTFPGNPFKTEIAQAGLIYGNPNSNRIYDAPVTVSDPYGNTSYIIQY